MELVHPTRNNCENPTRPSCRFIGFEDLESGFEVFCGKTLANRSLKFLPGGWAPSEFQWWSDHLHLFQPWMAIWHNPILTGLMDPGHSPPTKWDDPPSRYRGHRARASTPAICCQFLCVAIFEVKYSNTWNDLSFSHPNWFDWMNGSFSLFFVLENLLK